MTLTLQDIGTHLTAHGENLSRSALEALALKAYREHKLSTTQLRRLLGYRTRMQVHAFLRCTPFLRTMVSSSTPLPTTSSMTDKRGAPFRHRRLHDR